MNDVEVDRRFRAAWEQALAEWAAADPARRAAQAGCGLSPDGVTVPLFGRPYLVTHPGGDVSAGGAPAHVAVSILLLHYLLRADGVPPAGEWRAFRELPDGMFYAASFAQRAEAPLAQAFGAGSGSGDGLARLRAAAAVAGGLSLELADAAFAFQALPRLAPLPARRGPCGSRRAAGPAPYQRRELTARRRPAPTRRRDLRRHARWPPARHPARLCQW